MFTNDMTTTTCPSKYELITAEVTCERPEHDASVPHKHGNLEWWEDEGAGEPWDDTDWRDDPRYDDEDRTLGDGDLFGFCNGREFVG